jgi:hypothetical protein
MEFGYFGMGLKIAVHLEHFACMAECVDHRTPIRLIACNHAPIHAALSTDYGI